MSSKKRSITDLVTDLQRENERLKELKNLFNRACKSEFGYDINELHKLIAWKAQYDRKAAQQKAAQQGQQLTV